MEFNSYLPSDRYQDEIIPLLEPLDNRIAIDDLNCFDGVDSTMEMVRQKMENAGGGEVKKMIDLFGAEERATQHAPLHQFRFQGIPITVPSTLVSLSTQPLFDAYIAGRHDLNVMPYEDDDDDDDDDGVSPFLNYDREPEVIEQIFTSWSYIMMYLKKYLIQDINNLLKTTTHLRYYPKDYVQEFMAESIAFLLRNAPDKELTQGVMEIIDEVVGGPLDERKSGANVFLWHVMRRASSKFHSRADRVLWLMTCECIIGSERGSVGVVEVIAATFQRACEALQPKELKLIWSCVFDEISTSLQVNNTLLTW